MADPAVADILTPRGYPLGTKRICIDTDYYATFNLSHVRLVDLTTSPITSIVKDGIETADGHIPVDIIVLATGFDAVTGALDRMNVQGTGGRPLREKWISGPKTYLGIMSAGFPNFFMITGPGSPSVLSNVVVSIEQHVDWIANCIDNLRKRGVARIEAEEDAEEKWVAHINEVAAKTLFPRAASWYMGANVPGKPRVFLPYVGGLGNYRRICQQAADDGYAGFALTNK